MIVVNAKGVAYVMPSGIQALVAACVATTDFERFEDCLDCALMAQFYWEDNIGPFTDWPDVGLSRATATTHLQMVDLAVEAWLIFTRRTH